MPSWTFSDSLFLFSFIVSKSFIKKRRNEILFYRWFKLRAEKLFKKKHIKTDPERLERRLNNQFSFRYQQQWRVKVELIR